jgi:hypothetical protein
MHLDGYFVEDRVTIDNHLQPQQWLATMHGRIKALVFTCKRVQCYSI